MKKAFDQTVRDLKRGVNKKVLKVPGIEQKILDATSNEPWGPHGSHLADLAQATRNYHECQIIMTVIWKRINDTGKNWRHVYKALTVLEYLVAHGSERIINEIREHSYQISSLVDFQYIDSSGKDQGSNVRRKSQSLVALVNNRERIQELREKALSNNDRYRSSTGGAYRPGSNSSSGDYGDRYDDRFGGHYGNRDDDRNGYGREGDQGYRDGEKSARAGDPHNQDRDRYGKDYSERYERDSYRDEEYRGSRGNDDYQFGSRNRRSTDRDTERSFDDYDDRSSSRLSGQNVDAPPTYEEATRESESHIQRERNGGTMDAPVQNESSSCPTKPASLADDTSQSLDQASVGESAASLNKEVDGFDEFDPRVSLSGAPPSAGSPEMNFLGSLSVSDSVNSLAMMPLSSASTPEGDSMNSGPGMSFEPSSTASPVSSQPFEDPFGDAPFKATPQDNFIARPQDVAPVSSLQSSSATYGGHTLQSETPKPFENPFGDTYFKATQQDSFGDQPQNVAPDSSFQLSSGTSGGAEPLYSETVKAELAPSFDFVDTLGGLTYTPAIANGQPSPANLASLHLDLPGAQASCDPLYAFQPHTDPSAFVSSHGAQPVAPTYQQTSQSNLFPQSGFSTHAPPAAPIPLQATQPAPSTNIATDPLNLLPQSGLLATQPPSLSTTTSAGLLMSTQPSKAKFEPKSAVWADTLSRGLVDLNISGPKTNPLADIGIDFESINRMEKRKEMKISSTPVTSTITMGKAMGAGSGIGRTGASGLATPSNPMMGSGMNMGMGIGGGVGIGMGGGMGMGMAVYGGNTGQPMGMGMGMNMNMGMGTGMGMNMGMGQGAPVRPPAGMPLSSPGMPGVGYNPMMGMGGYGSQQPYGGGGYR